MFSALLFHSLAEPCRAERRSAVQLWISNDRFVGQRARSIRTEDDGYLVVFHADPDGISGFSFRSIRATTTRRGGKRYGSEPRRRGVRGRSHRPRHGVRRRVPPFRFDGYVLGDHWDYRALAPDRLPRDPETELTELARRLAGGSFDYDVLGYDVLERVVYASDYSYSRSYYGSYYDDPWCGGYYWRRCGSGVSIGMYSRSTTTKS
jgi:hypothetical protein